MKKIKDEYIFIENLDNQKTKVFIQKLKSESKKYFKESKLKQQIRKRLIEIQNINHFSVPFISDNGMFYALKNKKNKVYSVLYLANGLFSPFIIIDGNKIYKKGLILKEWIPNKKGDLIFYNASKSDNDQAIFFVFYLNTKKSVRQDIPSNLYPVFLCWDNTKDGFFYSRSDDNESTRKIYHHRLNDHYKNDVLIYNKNFNPKGWPSINISEDGEYQIINIFNFSDKEGEYNDFFIRRSLDGSIKQIKESKKTINYFKFYKNYVYRLTNKDADKWKIQKAKISDLLVKSKIKWIDVIKEKKQIVVSFKMVNDLLILNRFNIKESIIEFYDLKGKLINTVNTNGIIESISSKENHDYIYLDRSSFVEKNNIIKLSLQNKKIDFLFNSNFISNKNEFTQKTIYVKSRDSVKIPVNIIYKKNTKLNSKNPLLCYGYGGFGEIVKPSFNNLIIPFIEKGGIYAEIGVRGGGEFGTNWHKNGSLLKKLNSFNDFIDSLKYLHGKKYSNPKKTVIYGWSNGGLLVSTVAISNPNIIKAAVIGAPLTDMVRFHLFGVGRYWISEYGDPNNIKYLNYILKYSPYHNIKKNIVYPSMLFLVGESDDRVNPMHTYKFSYKLKNNKSDKKYIVRIEEKSGHSISAISNKEIQQNTDILYFIFNEIF